MVSMLESMVSVRSVYPDERELAEWLEGLLEQQGFDVRRIYLEEDRFCLVADRGDPDIGFYGHIDTVPVQGDWSHDPFDPVVEDGRMYGLGSFDMLGGVAAFLSAAFRTEGDVRLMLGVDEELYSRGAYSLVSELDLSDLEALVVPEIADTGKETGFPTAILGRRGRTAVEITVKGEPAHGARPQEGVSAVRRAVKVVEDLESLELNSHPELGEESVFVRRLESQSSSLSIPEEASIELDTHLVPPSTSESFLERVEQILPDYAEAEHVDRPVPFLEPYTTVRSELQSLLERHDFETSYGLSVADENVFGQHLPVLVIGPRGGNPHSADEWVDLDSLRQLREIFADFIEE